MRLYKSPARLPRPYATSSVNANPFVVKPPRENFLRLPPGFQANVFAVGLQSPRQLAVAPNGDVFVVESYQGRVTVLRDADGSGRSEVRSTFASGLKLPYGLAFNNGHLYVANTDSVVRYAYRDGQLKAAGRPEAVVRGIPHGGRKNHWTRNLVFDPAGQWMYLSVGSKTNKGIEPLPRAAIVRYDLNGRNPSYIATGIRNPVGMAFQPGSGQMWTTCVERDFMGDDLVPDFVTRVDAGDYFGWPHFYIGKHRDPDFARHKPPRQDVRVPDVLLEAHSVPLGLMFYTGNQFPPEYRGDLFVALRGSTNRRIRSGYEVIRISLDGDRRSPQVERFAEGWIPDRRKGAVYGRPVGLATARDGSMLVTDEAGHKIWRISYNGRAREN